MCLCFLLDDRSFLRAWGDSYPRATLLSQLQGLESHGAFSLKPFLLPTGIELTPEKSLGLFRVVELTEPSGQTSRAQGECSQEQTPRCPLLDQPGTAVATTLCGHFWAPRACRRKPRFPNSLVEMGIHPHRPSAIASFPARFNNSCSPGADPH